MRQAEGNYQLEFSQDNKDNSNHMLHGFFNDDDFRTSAFHLKNGPSTSIVNPQHAIKNSVPSDR